MMRAKSSLYHIQRIFLQMQRVNKKSTSAGETTKSTRVSGTSYSSSSNAIDADTHFDEGISTTIEKLPPRGPLVKNFFVGTVDKELMPYPEVVKREDLANLRQDLKPVETFFTDERFSKTLNNGNKTNSGILSPEFIEEVRSIGLFGINAEKRYHGKGWGWSESLLASEPETISTELSLGLMSHRAIIDLLQEVGTYEQKDRLIKRLAKGELIATEAIFEYEAPEDGYFNTKAEYCMDTGKWSICGEKAFVVSLPVNRDTHFLYLVIAETERLNVTGEAARSTTVFLVDSTLPGIWPGEAHKTLGCQGVPMRRVKFDRVQVPSSYVVGEPHEGNKYADILLRSCRLRSSMLSLGLAKNLVNELATHCAVNKQCGVILMDMEAIKSHLSRSLCAVYAIESMLFYTAGLLDEFNKPDVLLEAAIIKYYTLKELLALTTRSMDIIGPKSLHAGRITEQAFRDTAQLYTQGETMDTLRFFIALSGLQYAGALINESVRMSRNPLFHPGHFLGKLMQSSTIDTPKTKMRLADQLHPGLEGAALNIEHSVARLQMCVDLLLIRFGNNIVEKHNEMQRLADMATMIFAMFASASRASRSYCIGLQFADNEMLLASAICNHGRDLVKSLATDIFNGEILNNDRNLQRLSSQFEDCFVVWRGNAGDFRFYDAFFSAFYMLKNQRRVNDCNM